MEYYFIIALSGWLCVELILFLLFKWLRSDFQWLIMGADKTPVLNKKALEKFLKKGMDSELGWVRKPYTSGREKGRDGKKTQFTINKYGARSNPGYDNRESRISLFGDSYAFGRQVDNNQTWAHLVSKELDENILNFGVGNYGLDQALLRLEREQKKRDSDLYIILVVPETICRVQSVWKHYSEYGNTFAFKPRFKLKKGKLVLFPNIINQKKKYRNYVDYLDDIKGHDYFFKSKFLKDILTFPYLYSFSRSIKRNAPLILSLLYAKVKLHLLCEFKKEKKVLDRPFQKILKNNHLVSMSLYKNQGSINLMNALVSKGKTLADLSNSKFLFCIVPQVQDLELIKVHGTYYKDFMKNLESHTNILDLTNVLISQDDIRKCYTHDMYGGHLSKLGNEIVSKLIAKKVRSIMTTEV